MADRKPFEVINEMAEAVKQADELARAGKQLIVEPARVYDAVSDSVNRISALASTWGMDALTAAWTDEQRQSMQAVLTGLQSAWELLSPHPFPVIPAKPVPVPDEYAPIDEPTTPEV